MESYLSQPDVEQQIIIEINPDIVIVPEIDLDPVAHANLNFVIAFILHIRITIPTQEKENCLRDSPPKMTSNTNGGIATRQFL